MPDVHAGAGCVIGFTANLGDKVIPNIVGVDIGCGMLTVRLGKIDIDFKRLDEVIHRHIPSGRNVKENFSHCFLVDNLTCKDHLKNLDHLHASMGTLGGGNHFIEIDADEDGEKYLVIHTGSRNLGKQVAEHYQDLAIKTTYDQKLEVKNVIERLKSEGREQEIENAIKKIKRLKPSIPKDLCYLEGANRNDYICDMRICQQFADYNRVEIARMICFEMGWIVKSCFHTRHNYIDYAGMVRKGAISAHEREPVLIPLNMRDGCIIGMGLGNDDWNCSAPHGAGRLMSRAKAKAEIPLSEYQYSMSDVFTTSVCSETLDEAPQAYKPAAEIISCIEDTVKIVKIIKPVYNFKAKE